jgi:hypothetical protein
MKYLAMGLALGFFVACGPATVDEQVVTEQATEEIASQEQASCDLPPGCGHHCKAINSRTRVINKDTYLHEMSPACVPYGPVNGTVPQGSHFNVYFSDPYEPLWCYGYSVNLARKGYILCSSMS